MKISPTTGPLDGQIETSIGIYVDPFNLAFEDIYLSDIVTALSNKCRYGGHCSRFYSVAEHCVRMYNIIKEGKHSHIQEKLEELIPKRMKKEFLKACLLHDAYEAYIPDFPRPIKNKFNIKIKNKIYSVNDLEETALRTIFQKFNITPKYVNHPLIKDIDSSMLIAEAKILMGSAGAGWFKPVFNIDLGNIEPLINVGDKFIASFIDNSEL